MKFRRLTRECFLLYAIKNYDNPACTSVDDFMRDMKLFSYISKLLNRGPNAPPAKSRLLMNHIVTMSNLFGGAATTRMLFFYYPPKHHGTLKAILGYLNLLPESIPEAELKSVQPDPTFVAFLKTIK